MDQSAAIVTLKEGREKPVKNRHPWIFSGAIAGIAGSDPKPGEIVEISDSAGQWLARAYYNASSQIRARILTWRATETIDRDFWLTRMTRAIEFRRMLELEPETTAYRLINAESDGLPGLIVDKYGDYLVVQILTAGIDCRVDELVSILVDLVEPAGIVERSDAAVRKKEGLKRRTGLIYGRSPPSSLSVLENGIRMYSDLLKGHKSGLYLDQRDNRAAVCRPTYAANRELLNVFAYTGGFALNAAASGASAITNIEQSADLLETIKVNMALNGFIRENDAYLAGDAFSLLRDLRLNLQALHLMRPNGYLATFSCSGRLSTELFQKILFAAAVDAGRDVQIIQRLSQSADHPISVTFPESAYLKGFLCRVL